MIIYFNKLLLLLRRAHILIELITASRNGFWNNKKKIKFRFGFEKFTSFQEKDVDIWLFDVITSLPIHRSVFLCSYF